MLDNVHGNQRFVKHFQAQFIGYLFLTTAMESPRQIFPMMQENLSGTSTIDRDNQLYRFSMLTQRTRQVPQATAPATRW